MLIVAGHFEVDPDRRGEFISDREELMRSSRAEEGCLAYAMSADPVDPGRVLLFERWADKGALARHLEALRSAPRPAAEIPVLAAEVLQYEIGDVGPLGS